MAMASRGRITTWLCSASNFRNGIFAPLAVSELLQTRNYAARKGTREKARKKKVKVEVKKVAFVPHHLRGKKAPAIKSRRFDDSSLPEPVDNVYSSKTYRSPVYDFAEAIECHRETHHPSVYNEPDSKIFVNIELDMRAAKTNRFLDPFTRIIHTPYPIEKESPRSVLAFCKTHELQRIALEAGAAVAGDTELIKSIQNGDLNTQDFQFIVAHPNMLHELVTVRGLLKRKFPNQSQGTLDPDLQRMVKRYCYGLEYKAKVSPDVNDYGWIFAPFGKLDMETSQLEKNFVEFIKDVDSMRPKREGRFITQVYLVSLPSPERLKLNYKRYIGEVESEFGIEEDNEEDDDGADSDDEINKIQQKKGASITAG